ncbi:hypothetical protein TI39_contig4111g00014 [Zymoseptoria brevis]|uniref:Uncharacterized protein n=1 Tax=Zymoseptoria brevis TaxID=1047168 RepID=A0A0F4GDT9_9PEZI|nr:hypothetical protein TI39_contig4111g00014 [Zymoseptoria brevis]
MLLPLKDTRRPLPSVHSSPQSSSASAAIPTTANANCTGHDTTDEDVNATPPPPRSSACASVFALPELTG